MVIDGSFLIQINVPKHLRRKKKELNCFGIRPLNEKFCKKYLITIAEAKVAESALSVLCSLYLY